RGPAEQPPRPEQVRQLQQERHGVAGAEAEQRDPVGVEARRHAAIIPARPLPAQGMRTCGAGATPITRDRPPAVRTKTTTVSLVSAPISRTQTARTSGLRSGASRSASWRACSSAARTAARPAGTFPPRESSSKSFFSPPPLSIPPALPPTQPP